MKVNQEKIDIMLKSFDEGKTIANCGKDAGVSEDTARKYIKKYRNTKRGYMSKLSDDDINKICDMYQKNLWDNIYAEYPFLDKQKVYKIAFSHKAKKESYFWTEEDVNYLVNNFGQKSYAEMSQEMNKRHTSKAISAKAIKLGLTFAQDWTKEEENILKTYYPILPKEEFMKLLPNRTENAIVCHAMKFGIKGYHYSNEKYSEEQKQYILDNNDILTDEEIANNLNKTIKGIKEQKRKMGIYKINREYGGYVSLAKMLRGQLHDWKVKSMEACNYQCVLTGSKDYQIHHLYGFNKIFDETCTVFDEMGLLKSLELSDYTKEELDILIKVFHDIHKKYPLGECIRTDLHSLFHELYGVGNNTLQQWEEFKNKYQYGLFNDIVA